ncbi:MAG: hypothetical protein OEV78_11010 [Spirochaetia bacterium]|nr:hypothetical protein [Spirochaetia bacterium]
MLNKLNRLIIIGFLIFFVSINIAPESSINSAILSRAMNGEIIVSKIKTKHGPDGVKVVFCVEANKEDVWSTITDYNNFNNIFGNIQLKLIRENSKGAIVQVSLLVFNYTLYHKYIIPGEKYTWSRTSGDLKTVSGSWLILNTPKKNQQIIEYTSFIDAGNDAYNLIAQYDIEKRGKETAIRLINYLKKNYPAKK